MSETVFNEGSVDVDFRVEGNTATHAFFVEGETDRIGIATDDPGYQLDLRRNDTGTTTSLGIRQIGTGDASMAFQTTTSPYGFCIGVDGSDSDAFKIATGTDDVGTNTKLSIDNSGDITISELLYVNNAVNHGRTTAGATFRAQNNGNAAITLLSASNHSAGVGEDIVALNFAANNEWADTKDGVYAQIRCENDSGSYADRGRLVFATGYNGNTINDRMYMDSSGNVGIGAASFGPRLYSYVDGNEKTAYFVADAANNTYEPCVGIRADHQSGAGGQRNLITFYNGGTNIGEIGFNGSAISYGGTSDERLKKDISSYTGGLSIINQMGVKNFTWKEHDKKDVGLIAQELYNILPSRVVEGTGKDKVDRPWQIDHSRLVPYLINAIQELSAEVIALKGN